ncbi:MAG: hypothetical protein LBH95_10235 [Oscillospiraceae bacterium]|jgi:hypothetical protein|nr:hypothetical protein [Oscillospiraceae bacterium]
MEWLYGLIWDAGEYVMNTLMNVFSMDLSFFESSAPVSAVILDIMYGVGWALLLGNLVFQAAKSMMSGLGFEGDEPRILITRSFVFAFLLVCSRQICAIGLGVSARVVRLLQIPGSVALPGFSSGMFGFGASWLLVLIMGIILIFQLVKFFFEVGERHSVLGVLTILSPLAFAMGVSRNTMDIFKGWARMCGSMCLMMVLNVVFVKLIVSAMAKFPHGLSAVPWLIFVIALARVARKIDNIIARIGLNPAITGNGLGRGFPGMLALMVGRSIASSFINSRAAAGRAGAKASTAAGAAARAASGASSGFTNRAYAASSPIDTSNTYSASHTGGGTYNPPVGRTPPGAKSGTTTESGYTSDSSFRTGHTFTGNPAASSSPVTSKGGINTNRSGKPTAQSTGTQPRGTPISKDSRPPLHTNTPPIDAAMRNVAGSDTPSGHEAVRLPGVSAAPSTPVNTSRPAQPAHSATRITGNGQDGRGTSGQSSRSADTQRNTESGQGGTTPVSPSPAVHNTGGGVRQDTVVQPGARHSQSDSVTQSNTSATQQGTLRQNGERPTQSNPKSSTGAQSPVPVSPGIPHPVPSGTKQVNPHTRAGQGSAQASTAKTRSQITPAKTDRKPEHTGGGVQKASVEGQSKQPTSQPQSQARPGKQRDGRIPGTQEPIDIKENFLKQLSPESNETGSQGDTESADIANL